MSGVQECEGSCDQPIADHQCIEIGDVLAESSHTLEKLGKCMGLQEKDILEIEKDCFHVKHADKVTSIVSKWKSAKGITATWANLLADLSVLEDERVVADVESIGRNEEPALMRGIEETAKIRGALVAGRYCPANPAVPYISEAPADRDVSRNMRSLNRKFAALQANAYSALKKQQRTDEEYAIFFNSLVEGIREEITRDPHSIATTYTGKSLDAIFQSLSSSKAWYFLNFQVLADAVQTFGDPDIMEEIASYEQEVCAFRKATKFVDFLRLWHGRNQVQPLDCETVIAKLDNKWHSFTLQQVADHEQYLANEFDVRSLVFRLANGQGGCVFIAWHVVSSAIQVIKARLQQNPNLALGNIQALWIGKDLVFQAEPYRSMYDRNVPPTAPSKFWSGLAMSFLDWIKPFSEVSQKDKDGVMRWFIGGKLNASVLCIDRHMAQNPHKVALIWEKNDATHEDVTYQQLHEKTCKLANVLKCHGVKKGDRVVIYMPDMPRAVAAMLGCARIGAVHCVVFSSFDVSDLHHRIMETSAKVVITANEALHRETCYPLKKNVDEALRMEGGSTQVQTVFVAYRTDTPVEMTTGRDVDLDEAMDKQPSFCEATEMDSEDELFIMYTSGVTNSAKGIVHTHAGYLLYVAATHKYVFDYQPGDIFACVANLGWITGHSYVVYGPLCNGATSVLFEGSTPIYPSQAHYWEMIQRLKVTHLYTIPSVLKHLMKVEETGECLKKYDRSSLRTVGSVGEPLSEDVRKWVLEEVGQNRCTVLDTWWQTELGGVAITVEYTPTGDPKEPSIEMKPFFGVDSVVTDPKTRQRIDTGSGRLCLAKPLPGMGRHVIGSRRDLEFANIDENNMYDTKDMVKYKPTPGSGFRVTGRKKDAVRYKGDYLNLPELEAQLESTDDQIQDAVVVQMNQAQGDFTATEGGQCAYIRFKPSTSPATKEEVNKTLREKFPFVQAIAIEDFPKTPSGKVLRRVLKDPQFLRQGEEISRDEVERFMNTLQHNMPTYTGASTRAIACS